ncbi:MAG: adenine deaminase [Saprospiraceae bacterium]|nr:adenine deaminase [Saprospiraceae bacterium]
MSTFKGNIVDIPGRRIYYGSIRVENGIIVEILPLEGTGTDFLMPGFVDSHVHVESSMLVPSEFARLAVVHGTVGTVSDPHEIANVLGMEGVEFMIQNGREVPFKFYFGAPSCVPATTFETAGARLDVQEVEALLNRPEITYLSEMMNYPGVLFGDPDVLAKIEAAKRVGKPIDGHAPGLMGEDAARYIAAGISTDHECFTREEAEHKLGLGMKILIREGSAAKNFEALIDLLADHSDRMMFCSDDKHPDDLIKGHINQLAARAIARRLDLYDVLKVACWNPVDHYSMAIGRLRVGDPADFIRVSDLDNFEVLETWIDGVLVASRGETHIPSVPVQVVNRFGIGPKAVSDFQLSADPTAQNARIIRALNGEIVTESFFATPLVRDGLVQTDVSKDILKIAVINRYAEAPVALALINGFGLDQGAIASCVAHDSHNIVAVGTDDASLCRAVNLIIENKGGISAVSKVTSKVLPLPVAGIMAADAGQDVARAYSEIDRFVRKTLGSPLAAPFMTLSFMALLVIPELKLSDLGLFDGKKFAFSPLFVK